MIVALAIAGTVLNILAASWLLIVPFPDNLEAVGWGGGLPGVRKVLRQQRVVAGVVVLGTGLQFVALILEWQS